MSEDTQMINPQSNAQEIEGIKVSLEVMKIRMKRLEERLEILERSERKEINE